ncbi:hypothetical protein R2R35_09580 [Anaerocolumna sp. AGMB13020]|uniref:hypothetical protein n=1 Tax=Anaerocolumna sp. AGMB13020 TaxID=3081750 RepID=UPI002954AA58|nr:hypothetical protein [Anaerocolumna sp. AGMB13020]WOO38730.1 hypothetical protein R2R35_09580 [Anaerocolumna sp. AGMB13020]
MEKWSFPFFLHSFLKVSIAPLTRGGMIRRELEAACADCIRKPISLDRNTTAGTKRILMLWNLVSAVMPWHRQHLYSERCYAIGIHVGIWRTAFF